MGRSSPLSLLLLVLLVFGYGPRPSLAECTATNLTEVHEGEKVISAERPESENKVDVMSFVRPSSSFHSVNLTATAGEIDGSMRTVLFSYLIEADDECFKKDQWMKVSMWADLGNHPTLGFRVGYCWKECRADLGTATTGKLTLRWLNVSARGRSKWSDKVSDTACIKQLGKVSRPSNFPNCSTKILQSPSSSLPHANTSTQPSKVMVVIVVVVSLVVAMATGAILVLVVCLRKKRRNVTVADAAASSTHTVVRENSTYEASNDQDTARVIENEIYEPFGDGEDAAGGTTEVIENELYEPLSYGKDAAGGTTEVIENELYEPLSYGKNAAGGTTEVKENELYEPFSYTATPVGGRTKNTFYENVVEGEMEEETQDDIYETL